jgi:hypothetical protein
MQDAICQIDVRADTIAVVVIESSGDVQSLSVTAKRLASVRKVIDKLPVDQVRVFYTHRFVLYHFREPVNVLSFQVNHPELPLATEKQRCEIKPLFPFLTKRSALTRTVFPCS